MSSKDIAEYVEEKYKMQNKRGRVSLVSKDFRQYKTSTDSSPCYQLTLFSILKYFLP